MESSDDNDEVSNEVRRELESDDDEDVFDIELSKVENHVSDDEIDYEVLNQDEILSLFEEEISRVEHNLSLPRSLASTVLRYYNWNSTKVEDDWFSGQESVHAMVQFLQRPVVVEDQKRVYCKICFRKFKIQSMSCASCGEHYFCNRCWSEYLLALVDDGPACLMLKCPGESCNAPVSDDMIQKLAEKQETKDKLVFHRLRTFVESSKKIKWCPAPGCEYAAMFDSGAVNYDVTCKCGHLFCWRCGEEIHRPIDCQTVEKWALKNSEESENVPWIIAHTKPCPKCKRPIEKNHGCMHMTCNSPCKFQFCWLCLGPYSRTGCDCNKFKSKNDPNGTDHKLKRAKMYIEKYTHYYTRWVENGASRDKAVAFLRDLKDNKIDKIRVTQQQTSVQMNSIIDAWLQIVECRRFLRWTYVYGYYMPMNQEAKKNLFEHHQGLTEMALDWLHKCAEEELLVFINSTQLMKDEFRDFRMKLLRLTEVTKKYKNSFMEELEKEANGEVSNANGEKIFDSSFLGRCLKSICE